MLKIIIIISKPITNAKIMQNLFENESQQFDMRQTVQFIQEAYENLSIDTLVRAWEQYK